METPKTPTDAVNMLNSCVDELLDDDEGEYLASHSQLSYSNPKATNTEFKSCFMMRAFFYYDYIRVIKRPMIETNTFQLVINEITGELLLTQAVQLDEFRLLRYYYETSLKHGFEPFPDDHILFLFYFLSFVSIQVEAKIMLQRVIPDKVDDRRFTFLCNLLDQRTDLFMSSNMNFINAYNSFVAHIEDIVVSYTMLEDMYTYTESHPGQV